jgi:hypothetical protein
MLKNVVDLRMTDLNVEGKLERDFFFNYCLRRKDFSIGGTGSCGSTAY